MTTIVSISDTHNMLDQVDIPDGDILIHAGDATMGGRYSEVAKFLDQFEALPHKHKIFIAGNHDIIFEKYPTTAKDLLAGRDLIYLQDSSVVIDGTVFWGTPWTPPFGVGWAFNSDCPPRIGPCDVLITHGPPYGTLDMVHRGHVGCENLALHMEESPEIKLHVFGHIHEGAGKQGRSVNASTCTPNYKPTNPPIVVEI